MVFPAEVGTDLMRNVEFGVRNKNSSESCSSEFGEKEGVRG